MAAATDVRYRSLTMRFLVTGATGHVGPELISILLERGHALRAVVRDRAAPLDRNVEVFAGDLNAAETFAPRSPASTGSSSERVRRCGPGS